MIRDQSVRMRVLLSLVGRKGWEHKAEAVPIWIVFYLASKRSLVKGVRSSVKGMPYFADVEMARRGSKNSLKVFFPQHYSAL